MLNIAIIVDDTPCILRHGPRFETSIVVADDITGADIWPTMNKYIEENKLYSAPYRRTWSETGEYSTIDYGSHSKFFYAVPIKK